ncbi:adenylyltransferase/cytidyltransferase family protein [Marivivens marinus]|uniref:adenylyltransferase/cytidyltransferase family protein n=1 Tax=Marivivens marinus TaxID=3110173 RepID=UPI003B84A6BE
MKKVITFGTFDLLHEGHLRILQRARAEGDYLIVGVSSDQLNDRKGKRTVFPEAQRLAYVADLKYVDEVFLEESLELKDDYVKRFDADLLVMGDDWAGKFDWVSCDVRYLPRTEGISSTLIKTEIKQMTRCGRALFGDTYLDKHMDCALTIVNQLTARNVAPILTKENALPRKIDADVLVYFNKPINAPFPEYDENKRVLIDHGASHLKWFLGSRERFDFFDVILTAGPDHVRALQAIFDGDTNLGKARAAGFIKSEDLLSAPKMTREEVCAHANLDPDKPIILFAPTWHITANDDIIRAIEEVQKIDNHVASFHPETAHLPVGDLNTVRNINGITTELMKHADVVVSDLSSTIYEAAALNKPVVQLLLKEYPDNTATLYDLPLSAGTAEHFCGGLPCRPEGLVEAISQAASGDPATRAMMSACKDRILAGTYITAEATETIADQITLICEEKRKPPLAGVSAAPEQSKTPRYRRNLFFAKNRLIGHGGGNFNGHHASNSREAMEAALGAINIVELDFCMGKDGLIIAHDTFEPRYGLETGFGDTNVDAFLATRFDDALTPIGVQEAVRRATRTGKALVCDIKPTRDAYKEVAQELRRVIEEHGQIDQAVIQCYSVDDFTEAMRLGFKRVMLPAWKFFYRNPIGPEVFDFYRRCIEINADAVWGLSLPYINKHMDGPIIDHPDFMRMYAFWKRIFIHGAPPEEYPRILRMNAGLFADSIDRKVEFKDIPNGFNWQRYLFLNRDLMAADRVTEVEAIQHYLRFGQAEGRPTDYNLPEGFNYSGYINKNPKLRKSSINAFDSAAAHFTRYGSKEGLETG